MNDDLNRRPLKSRSAWWALRITDYLAKKNFTPNKVSLLSIVFAGIAGLALLLASSVPNFSGNAFFFIVAALGIQLRLLCNLLDGMLAVEKGLKSETGELYNEIPDRISDILIFIGAGLAAGEGLVIGGLLLGFLASIAALLTAYIRVLGAACGTTHYFLGPMAKQHRMALLTLVCLVAPWVHTWQLVFALSLWIIFLGGIWTCVRRVRAIARDLPCKPS